MCGIALVIVGGGGLGGGAVTANSPPITKNHYYYLPPTTGGNIIISRTTTATRSCCAYTHSVPVPVPVPVFTSSSRRRRRRINYYYYYSTPSISPLVVMQWQDCKVKMDIQVPASVAYKCYLDREAIPRWMPFISSVKTLEDKPDISRWSLKYNAFGQDLEFSWLSRNMQPIPNQKIHWRSLEGLPNRGAVRFYPKGPSSCTVELTVSYEVPQILVPVASALQPLLESLLIRGLERFANFASSYSTDKSR